MRRRKSAPLELDPMVVDVWEDSDVARVVQPIHLVMQKEMRRTLDRCSMKFDTSIVIILHGLLLVAYGFYWWVVCAEVCFMCGLSIHLKNMALKRTLGLWTGAVLYKEGPDGQLFLTPVRGQGALRTFQSSPFVLICFVNIVLIQALISIGAQSDIALQLAAGLCLLLVFSANLYVFLVREYIELWYKCLIPVWKATQVFLRPVVEEEPDE